MIRWTTLKGVVAILLFLIIAALIQYSIIIYAINIGVKEEPENLLQWNLPGTNWTITISPLFHLVPITVIITLLFCWTYLTRHIAIKPYDLRREKVEPITKKRKEQTIKKLFGKIRSGLLKVKGIAYLWQKIHFARATIKSALTILLVFATFILLFSLLAYPKLIYQTISSAYQNNPSLLSFVKNTADALAPIGEIFSPINGALISAAPSFRDFVLGIGTITKPLTDLDNVGKYLAFQNFAAWISAFAVLFYGEYIRKGYQYKKRRKR